MSKKSFITAANRFKKFAQHGLYILLILLTLNIITTAQAEERREKIVELAYDEVAGKVLDKFVSVKLSPQCWEQMLKGDGKSAINFIQTNIAEHALLMKYGDLGSVGGGSGIEWDKVDRIFDKMNGNFYYTIEAPQAKCNAEQWDVMSRFSYFVTEFFSKSTLYSGMGYGWRPRSGKMIVKTVFSPTATNASVAISNDGVNFTITVPSGEVDNLKWNGWMKIIENGMAKGGAKTAEN
jgi:hypothetical protein